MKVANSLLAVGNNARMSLNVVLDKFPLPKSAKILWIIPFVSVLAEVGVEALYTGVWLLTTGVAGLLDAGGVTGLVAGGDVVGVVLVVGVMLPVEAPRHLAELILLRISLILH